MSPSVTISLFSIVKSLFPGLPLFFSQLCSSVVFFFDFFLHLFVFDRQKETEHKWGGAEREGDTESEAGSRLRAVSTEPYTGLELEECETMT